MDREIFIVGAGASGLAAAVTAAGAGAKVCVAERMDKAGKKILATGNGKCNYTNRNISEACYRSENPAFISAFVRRCRWEDTVDFFHRLGIYPKERDGYFYPNSEQASSVRDVLLQACEQLGVNFVFGEEVTDIRARQGGFQIKTKTHHFEASSVIIAAGGRAYPKLGSNGSGYILAKGLSHDIVPVVPALCGLRCLGKWGQKPEAFWKKVAGVRADAEVSLKIGGVTAAKDTGQVQLTGYGISGIPVFQISRFAARALTEGKKAEAWIDFFPKLDRETLFSELKFRCRGNGPAAQMMTGLVNDKLIPIFLEAAGIAAGTKACTLKNSQLSRLVQAMKQFDIQICKTNTFDEAQVCAGGVNTLQVDFKTMASKKQKGLYFSGEILDVDGICGGYNLHFAWQTGMIAGQSAAAYVKEGKVC